MRLLVIKLPAASGGVSKGIISIISLHPNPDVNIDVGAESS